MPHLSLLGALRLQVDEETPQIVHFRHQLILLLDSFFDSTLHAVLLQESEDLALRLFNSINFGTFLPLSADLAESDRLAQICQGPRLQIPFVKKTSF